MILLKVKKLKVKLRKSSKVRIDLWIDLDFSSLETENEIVKLFYFNSLETKEKIVKLFGAVDILTSTKPAKFETSSSQAISPTMFAG